MSDTKPPSASRTETTHLIMPSDANVYGTAFGGMGSSLEMMVSSLAEPAMLMAVFASLNCLRYCWARAPPDVTATAPGSGVRSTFGRVRK